jgi:hypothetical protein
MGQLSGLFNFVSANAGWLIPLVAAVGTLVIAFVAIAKAVQLYNAVMALVPAITQAVAAAQMVLNAVMALNPFVLIVIAIIAVIAIFVLLYEKVSWFRDAVNAVMSGIVSVMVGAWNAVVAAFNAVMSFFQQWGMLILTVLLGPIVLVFQLIMAAVNGGWSGVVALFQSWLSTLVGVLSAVVNILATPFIAGWNMIRSNVITPLQGAWGAIVGAVGAALAAVTGVMVAPFVAAYNAIQSRVIGPLKSVWNSIAGAISSVSFSVSIPDWVPIIGGKTWSWSAPHIPRLQRGGLVLREGLAYVHAAEVISPAPASLRTAPVLNIEHAEFRDPVDVDVFSQRLAWKLRTAVA